MMKKILMPALFLIAIGMLAACENTETATKKRFIVLSTGAGFTGYYYIDGGDREVFSDGGIGSNDSYYEYRKELEYPATLKIHIDAKSSAVPSLQLLIYDDTKLIREKIVTPGYSGQIVTLDDYYEFSSKSSSSAAK